MQGFYDGIKIITLTSLRDLLRLLFWPGGSGELDEELNVNSDETSTPIGGELITNTLERSELRRVYWGMWVWKSQEVAPYTLITVRVFGVPRQFEVKVGGMRCLPKGENYIPSRSVGVFPTESQAAACATRLMGGHRQEGNAILKTSQNET
jgi:hypothetical protein